MIKRLIVISMAVMTTVLALVVVWQFRIVIIYVLISLLLAAVLRPLVNRLVGRGFLVRTAWVLLYLVVLGCFGFLLYFTGKTVIKEAIFEGPTVEMAARGEIDSIGRTIDLTVLVAPFRTVDYFVSKIPLVSYVLSGTLISMPVKVTGDWDSPKVEPLSPSAVSSELLGIMGRTLELPFRLIDPFLLRKKESQDAP